MNNSSLSSQAFYKKQYVPETVELNKVMNRHMIQQPLMPNKIERPVVNYYKALNLHEKMNMTVNQSNYGGSFQNITQFDNKYQNRILQHQLIQSRNPNIISSHNISLRSNHFPSYSSNNFDIHFINKTKNNLQSLQKSYLLLSKFPLLSSNDKIYLPLINRLQNLLTHYCFNQLYVNLKYLLIQNDEQFWKYLYHLYLLKDEKIKKINKQKTNNVLMNQSLRQDQINQNQNYQLRLALQSCLQNFTIKQYNKYFSLNQMQQYQQCNKELQNVLFNTKGFKLYEKLMSSILQFYQKLLKINNYNQKNQTINHLPLNEVQKQIISSTWYIDTLKAIQLCHIYGNKQPQRIKKLIKIIYSNINPQIFILDFKNYLLSLKNYILNDDQYQISIQQCLNLNIQVLNLDKQKYKSNFKRILTISSECLKIFTHLTIIFKFFPSFIKLTFFSYENNLDLLKIITKISKKITFNLLNYQFSPWKLNNIAREKIKIFIHTIIDKIIEMYKFMFLNVKNALQQCIQQIKILQKNKQIQLQTLKSNSNKLKIKQVQKRQKVLKKFYKKLIKQLVNRKKNEFQISQTISFISQKQQFQYSFQSYNLNKDSKLFNDSSVIAMSFMDVKDKQQQGEKKQKIQNARQQQNWDKLLDQIHSEIEQQEESLLEFEDSNIQKDKEQVQKINKQIQLQKQNIQIINNSIQLQKYSQVQKPHSKSKSNSQSQKNKKIQQIQSNLYHPLNFKEYRQYGKVLISFLLKKQFKNIYQKNKQRISQSQNQSVTAHTQRNANLQASFNGTLNNNFVLNQNNSSINLHEIKYPNILYNQYFFSQYQLEHPDKNFIQHLQILQQFQKSIKQQFIQQTQQQQLHKTTLFRLKQIPSLKQFKQILKLKQHQQLLKKLNKPNKQYEDQPTFQQEILQEQQEYLKFNDEKLEDFTELDWENYLQDKKILKEKRKKQLKNNKAKGKLKEGNMPYVEQDYEDDILSPQEIDQSQCLLDLTCFNNSKSYSNSYLMNQKKKDLNSSNKFISKSINNVTNLNSSQIINNSININQAKLNTTSNNLSNNKVIKNDNKIFIIHKCLKKVRNSMIHEQLEYFQKYKNTSWQQISSISIRNKNKNINKSNISNNINKSFGSIFSNKNDSLLLQIKDIGFSFDMVLEDIQQQQQEQQSSFIQNNGEINEKGTKYSHFYYNIVDKNDKYTLKSFMNDYQWSINDQKSININNK